MCFRQDANFAFYVVKPILVFHECLPNQILVVPLFG